MSRYVICDLCGTLQEDSAVRPYHLMDYREQLGWGCIADICPRCHERWAVKLHEIKQWHNETYRTRLEEALVDFKRARREDADAQ